MRTYELTFIVTPALPETEVDGFLEQMQGYIKQTGAQIEKFEKLGRRRLAYEIGHQREGIYVMVTLQANGSEISEIERRLRVTDSILRFMTVRVDVDHERARRMADARTKRISRKAAARTAREPVRTDFPAGSPAADHD